MTLNDQCVDILRLSADGNRLSPVDLKLVEAAVNTRLTEIGEVALAELHAKVVSGDYFQHPQWLQGVSHLTKDHEGYVYWRGQRVEHYSLRDADSERAAAERLAQNCLRLESNGFPVSSRSVLDQACLDAPPNTPWKQALLRYYSFFTDGTRVLGIFYRPAVSKEPPGCFIVERQGDKLVLTDVDGAYEAFHYLQDQGFKSMGAQPGYEELVSRLERLGITPEALDAELARPDPTKQPF